MITRHGNPLGNCGWGDPTDYERIAREAKKAAKKKKKPARKPKKKPSKRK